MVLRLVCMFAFVPLLDAGEQESNGAYLVQIINLQEANSAALRQYDVLVTRHRSAIKGSIGHESASDKFRIKVDMDTKVAALFGSGTQLHVGFRKGDDVLTEGSFLDAAVINGTKSIVRRHAIQLNISRNHTNFGAALDECDFLNLDFVGFTQFPVRPFPLESPTRLTNPREEPGKLWDFVRARLGHAEPEPAIGRDPKFSAQTSAGGRIVLSFDKFTLLPKSRTFFATKEIDDDNVVYKEFYEWEKIDGIDLPREIYRDRKRSVKSPDSQDLIEFEENILFEFKWISVNKPIDITVVDPGIVDRPHLIRQELNVEIEGLGPD